MLEECPRKELNTLPASYLKNYQRMITKKLWTTSSIDEAGPENEESVIVELGSPKEAAHDIMVNLWIKIGKKMIQKHYKRTANCHLVPSSCTSSHPAGFSNRHLVFVFSLTFIFAFVLAIDHLLFCLCAQHYLGEFDLYLKPIHSKLLLTLES